MQPNQASPDILNALQSIALAIEAQRAAPTNPYKFSVYRNAAFNPGAGAYAKVVFDVEDHDTNSNFASGTYTIPVTGYYRLAWHTGINISAGNSVSALYKNGVIHAWGNEVPAGGGSGGSIEQLFAAGDTVDIYVYQAVSQLMGVGGAPRKTFFSGELVSVS